MHLLFSEPTQSLLPIIDLEKRVSVTPLPLPLREGGEG